MKRLLILLLSSPLLLCRAATSTVPKSTLATDALNFAVPPFGKGTEYYDWLNAEPERQICSKSTRKDFEEANPAARNYFNMIENGVPIDRIKEERAKLERHTAIDSVPIAFELAIEVGRVDLVWILPFQISSTVDINWDCLLNLAAKNHGNMNIIQSLLTKWRLERDHEWYFPELDGQALYNACSHGFADAARRLIGRTKEKERLKAFLIAVEHQDTEVVKHFVEFGIAKSLASIAEENGNLTMDQLAWLDTIPALVRQEFFQSIKELDEKVGIIPADWDDKQLYCKSLDLETRIEALELAVQYGKLYPVQQLLSGEQNNNNINLDRLIEIAAENYGMYGKAYLVKLLLSRPKIREFDLEAPIDVAAQKGYARIIELLLEARGNKPLTGNALYKSKNAEAVILLIQPTAKKDRIAAFVQAVKNRNDEIVRLFIAFDNGCVPNPELNNRYLPLSTFIPGENGVYKDSRKEADKGLQKDSVKHLNEKDLSWLNDVNLDWFWRVYKKHWFWRINKKHRNELFYESNPDRSQREANDKTIKRQLEARRKEFLTKGPALYNACMQNFQIATELLKKGSFVEAVAGFFGFGSQSVQRVSKRRV